MCRETSRKPIDSVELARDRVRRVTTAGDQRRLRTEVAQTTQRIEADSTAETKPAMVGVRPDRLELADAVHLVEPGERVCGDRPVGRFDHAVEVGAISQRRAHEGIDVVAEA